MDYKVNKDLTKIGKNTYVIVDEKDGSPISYKLIRNFLNGEHEAIEKKLNELEKKGIICVNTITPTYKTGPNLICIDGEKFSTLSEEELENFKGEHIHIYDNPEITERKKVEQEIKEDAPNRPAGDVTIWDPKKDKIIGLMFSNSAPTIKIKSDNGMVGFGVLRRQDITKELFRNLKKVMSGNIEIEVISSAMGKYPAVKQNDDGTINNLLPDASNQSEAYTLPEYINDVLNQINVESIENGDEEIFTCNYKDCIDIDTSKHFYSNGEKAEDGSLGNTAIIFDPSDLLK